jgi:hypothetical protein
VPAEAAYHGLDMGGPTDSRREDNNRRAQVRFGGENAEVAFGANDRSGEISAATTDGRSWPEEAVPYFHPNQAAG